MTGKDTARRASTATAGRAPCAPRHGRRRGAYVLHLGSLETRARHARDATHDDHAVSSVDRPGVVQWLSRGSCWCALRELRRSRLTSSEGSCANSRGA